MNNTDYADVVIIGGGASGLAAAIELGMKAPGLGIVILEKNPECARKIRATGSGRCNITNRDAEGYLEIAEFFTRIGLVTRTYDNGLVYPYSESAADVAELLISRAKELGVRIITGAEVTGLSLCPDGSADGSEPGSFEVSYELTRTDAAVNNKSEGEGKVSRKASHRVLAQYLVLACGGKAGPMFGTTGDGYGFARSLGHSVVTPVPVLTSIECREWEDGASPSGISLAGTRTRGTVTLQRRAAGNDDPPELFRETGEIQFTRYGISGICVFNMTRHMRYNRSAGESLQDFTVTADLFPDGSIEEFIRDRRDNALADEMASDVLRTVLKENIAAYVIRTAENTVGSDYQNRAVRDLSDSDIRALSKAVHGLSFCPVRLRGWKEAQATSGGVSLDEIDKRTCESLIAPGLFITGELADRDFMCGGFNLSNAWLTGLLAAREIAFRERKDN